MLLYHYLAMVIMAALATVSTGESTRNCSTLQTYDAHMLPNAGNYTERRTRIPKDLLMQDADVYCLQQYWQECDLEQLLAELNSTFPYHFSAIHRGVGNLQETGTASQPPCSQAEMTYYESTVQPCREQPLCPGFPLPCPESVPCGSELSADDITADCVACTTLYDASPRAQCSANEGSCNKRFNPPGLVLLSKKPISGAQYVRYFPDRKMAHPTGYLKGEVEGLGTIVCTALTVTFPIFFEFDSAYSNSSDQQFAEIDKINADFGSVNHFLMGGFKTGPNITRTNVQALNSGHYQRLIDSGYSAPYVEMSGECTFCSNSSENSIADQILIKGSGFTANTVQRVLDSTQPLGNDDIYGVQVEVCADDQE